MHDEQKTTASHVLGSNECSRLRERVHGRDLSVDELFHRLKPYLLASSPDRRSSPIRRPDAASARPGLDRPERTMA